MYTVIKENKKPMTYKFETFEQLDTYASKQRYTKGNFTLLINDVKVNSVSNGYDLASLCLFVYGKLRDNAGVYHVDTKVKYISEMK